MVRSVPALVPGCCRIGGVLILRKGGETMFLIKCKCGSIFTIHKDNLDDRNLLCPNCKKKIELNSYTSVAESQGLPNQVESITYLPNNAKITVTFDA